MKDRVDDLMTQPVKINVIAKLLNMSPDAIRFYEKKGIINPPRDPESRYREYSASEIRRLYDCANWTALGFTIREVETLMHTLTETEMSRLLEEREQALRHQLEDTQLALNKLSGYKQARALSPSMLMRWDWIDAPLSYFYCYSHHDELNEAMIFSPLYQPVMQYRNLFTCAVLAPVDLLEAQRSDFDFGFIVTAEAAARHGFQIQNPIRSLPGQKCLRTIIQTEAVIQSSDLLPLLTQLRQMQIQLKGDWICRVLSLDYDQGKQTRRYELWIPAEVQ